MVLRKLLVVVCFLVLSGSYISAQYRTGGYEELYDSETVVSMKKHVSELSAAHLEGRRAGSEGERAAAQYVADAFRSYGIDVLTPATG